MRAPPSSLHPARSSGTSPRAGDTHANEAPKIVGQKLGTFVAKQPSADLEVLGELLASERIMPVIDRPFQLGEAADAVRHVAEGRARGTVVITV